MQEYFAMNNLKRKIENLDESAFNHLRVIAYQPRYSVKYKTPYYVTWTGETIKVFEKLCNLGLIRRLKGKKNSFVLTEECKKIYKDRMLVSVFDAEKHHLERP